MKFCLLRKPRAGYFTHWIIPGQFAVSAMRRSVSGCRVETPNSWSHGMRAEPGAGGQAEACPAKQADFLRGGAYFSLPAMVHAENGSRQAPPAT
jgi:hypothetical protein